MKFDAEHVRRVKRLWQQLKKEGGATALPPVEDPMDQLIEGVFSNYAAESRAHSAATRLRGSAVDLNEMRVTPVSELVEIVGADYPMGRAAAEELVRTLTALFNRTHKTDLMFLKKQSRKGAETFLNRLDSLGAYAKATILQRCFKAPIIPVDVHMLSFLKKTNCVPQEATAEDVQKFLKSQIRDSEAMSFFVHLKRHAAAHAPRKPLEYHHPAPVPAPIPEIAPVPVVVAQKESSRSRSTAPVSKTALTATVSKSATKQASVKDRKGAKPSKPAARKR